MKQAHGGPSTSAEGSGQNNQIYTYFGALTLVVYLATPSGALVDISTSFMLKNQLHASPETVSNFRFITAIPVFLAFIFGLLRDQWNPFGLRDRGYLIFFAPLTGTLFIWLSFGNLSLSGLTVGLLAAMVAFRLVMAAYQALMSLVGQERLMSGRIATLWQVAASVPALLAAWGSGWVTTNLKPNQIFYVLAGLCFALGAIGLWQSKAVFAGAYDKPVASHANFFKDVKRLIGHRAIYGAVMINFLWNFAPGFATPLQYYVTDKLHLPDAAFSNFNAIFAASFIPTFLLYGILCKKLPQSKLLFWGTVVAVPQMIPLLFVHSALTTELMAVPIGLMGGVATAAYFDLAIRSCPPGLQGTLMMLVDGVLALSARGGDRLGTWIYSAGKENGFLYCVIATTAVYALILPLILIVPKNLISTSDGQVNPQLDAEVAAEIAASN
jgi:hypothetical protein